MAEESSKYRLVVFPNGQKAYVTASATDEQVAELFKDATPARREKSNELGWGDALVSAVKHIPESATNVVLDTADAFIHPIDTLGALGKVAGGAAYKMTGIPYLKEYEPNADAMGKFLSDRYGGLENIKQTIANDPIGILADLSTVFTGGAGAARGAGAIGAKLGASAQAMDKLNKARQVLSKASIASDPMSLAIKGTNYGLGKITGGFDTASRAPDLSPTPNAVEAGKPKTPLTLSTAAEKLYQSALGINTGYSNNGKARYSNEQRRAMLASGIKNRIPVSEGGFDKANSILKELETEKQNAIKNAADAGLEVDVDAIENNIKNSPVLKELQALPSPTREIEAWNKKFNDWILNKKNDYRNPIEADEGKRSVYKLLEPTYNNNAAPMLHGSRAFMKEMARYLKTGVNDVVDKGLREGIIQPLENGKSINELNAKEGALIDLLDNIERQGIKNGNKSPFNILGALSGSVMSGGDLLTTIATGFALPLLQSPQVKSRGAFLLDDMTKVGNPFKGRLGTMYLGEQAWADDKKINGGR